MIDENVDITKKRLARVLEKFNYLKSIDKNYQIFGAEVHRYRFRRTVEPDYLINFERKHNVKIPYDFKLFLSEVGNGGAGPFYGIIPFETCLFSDIDYPSEKFLLNPSKPFQYTHEWNMEFEGDYENEEELDGFQREYFDDKHINGTIRICNFGCGHFINLVVNGEEYSHIWSDDRGSD